MKLKGKYTNFTPENGPVLQNMMNKVGLDMPADYAANVLQLDIATAQNQ